MNLSREKKSKRELSITSKIPIYSANFKTEMVHLWRTEQIKNIKIGDKYAQLDRMEYLLQFYSYLWFLRTRNKLYICFWKPN